MKIERILFVTVILTLLYGCVTTELKMEPVKPVEVEGVQPHPLTAGLYFPEALKHQVHKIPTSPFDVLSYPVGEQTVQLFRKNLGKVFRNVTELDSKDRAGKVDLILEPEIVKFAPVVPSPAYNPYSATIVYRVAVTDSKGGSIMTSTVTGESQTGGGLMSGFKAQELLAEAANMAMDDAMTQIIQGLADAEELRNLSTGLE